MGYYVNFDEALDNDLRRYLAEQDQEEDQEEEGPDPDEKYERERDNQD